MKSAELSRHCPVEICHDDERIVYVRSATDLRDVLKNWKTFSNDVLGMLTIPTQDKTRAFKQYPIEFDPPEHTKWRRLVEDTFRRPLKPDYIAAMTDLISSALDEMVLKGEVEVVSEFGLPLQSRALTLLLNVPPREADIWVGWGNNVFGSDDYVDLQKAAALNLYIEERVDNAASEFPGSFFSLLVELTVDGRNLTRDEMMGFSHLVFAGGRGTLIKLIAAIVGYFAKNPEELARLKEEPRLVTSATEEMLRFVSPLAMLARVSTIDAEVNGVKVATGQRVGLCYAKANRDAEVFANPDEFVIDRLRNPHLGFGLGVHTCLGNAHARLVSRVLMSELANRQINLEILSEELESVDLERDVRDLRYSKLIVRVSPESKQDNQHLI